QDGLGRERGGHARDGGRVVDAPHPVHLAAILADLDKRRPVDPRYVAEPLAGSGVEPEDRAQVGPRGAQQRELVGLRTRTGPLLRTHRPGAELLESQAAEHAVPAVARAVLQRELLRVEVERRPW